MPKTYIGLTELRGIACIFVFTSHLSYITRPYFYAGFLGHFGVMIFLMLSGFLGYVNHANEKLDTLSYISKKYKSFFCLYFLLIFIMAIPKFLQFDFKKTILSIIIHIPLLQTWLFPFILDYQLNTVDWYLSVIMFCWLLEKPIIKILKKTKYKETIYAILGIIFFARIILYYAPPIVDNSIYNQFLYLSPIIRILDFISGMLLAKYHEIVALEKQHFTTFFEITSISLFIISIIAYNCIPIKCSEIVFAGTASLLLVSTFADNNSIITKILNQKWLFIVAKHSLTIYLIHYPIIYYIIVISSKLNIPIIFRVVLTILSVILCTFIIDIGVKKYKPFSHTSK